jgi:hypothetical protein
MIKISTLSRRIVAPLQSDTEQRLQESLRFATLLAKFAATFVNVPSGQIGATW